jgi:hypothetical protein
MVQCTPVNAGVTLITKCSDNDGELTLTWKEEAAIEGVWAEGGVCLLAISLREKRLWATVLWANL